MLFHKPCIILFCIANDSCDRLKQHMLCAWSVLVGCYFSIWPDGGDVYRHNAWGGTHYWAESLSWYSRARLKHSWMPESAHKLFMAARSSGEYGSVSSMRLTTSHTILASACTEGARDRTHYRCWLAYTHTYTQIHAHITCIKIDLHRTCDTAFI